MTKNDIVLAIAAKSDIQYQVARAVVQKTLDGMLAIIATEGRLELRDFGVFEVRARKAHRGNNPRTGEPVMIPEKMVTYFKSGKFMMKKILAASEQAEPESAQPQSGTNNLPRS